MHLGRTSNNPHNVEQSDSGASALLHITSWKGDSLCGYKVSILFTMSLLRGQQVTPLLLFWCTLNYVPCKSRLGGGINYM